MDLKNKASLGLSVLRYKLTGKRIPVAVAWLITGRCNLDCCYCKWKDLRRSEELDTAAVKDMIEQMKRAGVRLISFTGGEPLVRADIGEIIRHVKDSGLVCKLNTNGMLVESRLDDLRRLDLLQISVDGPPAVQDRLRGEGTSEKAARAIKLARNAGIRVQLIACLTRDNVVRLDEVLDYGLELGVGLCFQLLTFSAASARNQVGWAKSSRPTGSPDNQMVGREDSAHPAKNREQGYEQDPEERDDETADESMPDRDQLIESLEYLVRLRKEKDPRAAAIASKKSELDYYIDLLKNGSPGCQCTLVTATMMPDGRLIFCGNAKSIESYDAVELGFAEAFSRLTIPDCDGCVCVGKLRLSKVYQFDLSVLKEMLALWR